MKKSIIIFILIIKLAKISPTPIKLPVGFVQNSQKNLELLNSGDYQQNAEELSGQFEGDIILTANQANAIAGKTRTGLLDETAHWPNNIVYYTISDGYFSQEQLEHIRNSLDKVEATTCLRFIERTNEVDYVFVMGEPSGCWSHVGRQGGRQELNLQLSAPENGCFRSGTIIHEFFHAMGFYHMQSATERDDFVKIKYEHIESGLENNFETYPANEITNYGIPYDATSIMHYGAYGFSKNGYATIVPNDIKIIPILGQRLAMTDSDIARVNSMYKCEL